jgi:hypothetical protein
MEKVLADLAIESFEIGGFLPNRVEIEWSRFIEGFVRMVKNGILSKKRVRRIVDGTVAFSVRMTFSAAFQRSRTSSQSPVTARVFNDLTFDTATESLKTRTSSSVDERVFGVK